jgi:hypothetical protein
MSAPTPLTISIISTLSGSTRMRSPALKLPESSHVQIVEGCERSWGDSPQSAKSATQAQTKEAKVAVVAR